ncbi:MAG: hypothetical protein ABFD44_14455 [Anaerolineaceae bacterium]
MKKFLIALAVVGVVVAALGTAGVVYAQTQTPPQTQDGTWGYGMMGGRGMMGGWNTGNTAPRGPMVGADGTTGWLHDEMVAAFAEKLGMTVEEVEQKLAEGVSMAALAQEKGMTQDEFITLMKDVRSAALAAAVENGDLTQEQADRLSQRMGGANGARGRGAGAGWSGCPMWDNDDD